MNSLYIPEGYAPRLDVYRTQKAIAFIKETFQRRLADALGLKRVSAPLFVTEASGLNDNLSGVERPVSFDIPAVGESGQVVHSLAKWKRQALKDYRFYVGNGLYTDMNAIRRDEELDNIHSIYVDQWDWEKVITKEERTREYLIDTVKKIVGVICDTNELLKIDFPELSVDLVREVSVITSEELLSLYPTLTPKEREYAYVKEHKTVLIIGIGGKLSNGEPHDSRAPDYDDWELNGDIMFYNEVLDRAFEISSMGIRVDKDSLMKQLKLAGCEDRAKLPFHKMLLSDELPLTVGGGIGQSRLCMLMMGCAHIGEVQSSIWDKATVDGCKAAGIRLL
ncbi:MAG: aspartate--ammonia ligase [Clostridia bacterium]|nr:aspartate--ammonia ligase [Clostridia bacterium]